MSSNTATSVATNQALIALLDRLNKLVEQVLQSQSEEEKMRSSLNIASQLNDVIHSYCTVATYIPLGLLSIAAGIHQAQRGTVHLVQVMDWNHVGHNDDICQGRPLYPKTLASAPVAILITGPSLPVPVLAPIPKPAPAPIPVPAPAPACPSKSCKCQFSISPPHPVKRARKTTPKSKWILTDTNSNGNAVHLEKDKVKGKAKAKARTPSPSLDTDQEELDVHNKVTDKFKPDDEYEYEDDNEDDSEPVGQLIVKLAKGQEQSKASKCQTGVDKFGSPAMREVYLNEGGLMRCIQPEQPDTLITPTGPTPMPIPPVAPITTHSKTTRKGKTGEISKDTDINTP
ncbi:hypothetical protein BDR04DRAFT_1120272 [Suillus decipiens]|nr:hypothetical protein BDR04DRAFT_1120272 [Suillus decipiens]